MTEQLPALNALLNFTSFVLLVTGRRFIKAGRREKHRAVMLSAVAVSVCFLSSYLTYHSLHGSTPFTGTGWSRTVYFTILISHTFLAAVNVPLVAVTLTLGLRSSFERHKKIARITFPVWIYVSVTGVLIYFLLYHLFPGAG